MIERTNVRLILLALQASLFLVKVIVKIFFEKWEEGTLNSKKIMMLKPWRFLNPNNTKYSS